MHPNPSKGAGCTRKKVQVPFRACPGFKSGGFTVQEKEILSLTVCIEMGFNKGHKFLIELIKQKKVKKILLTFISTFVLTFLYAQTPGYDLYSIMVDDTKENPIEGIEPITDEKQPADSTLDIVNWNIIFFGAPQMTDNKYGTRDQRIENVAAKLIETNADVYGLQEVVVDSYNGNALTDLVSKMNELAGDSTYAGAWSEFHSLYWNADNPSYPSQCLAYVWNINSVSVNNCTALLEDVANRDDFGYGRLPYMLDADITVRGITQRYLFINLHLKAKTGYSDMRAESMALLIDLLKTEYATDNVVVLGDYNVADDPGAIGEINDWEMYQDADSNGVCDYVHVAGNKSTGIEHILISDELFDELKYISEWDWNTTVDGSGSLSDHMAYMTSLYVHESDNYHPTKNYTMTITDYQIIVDSINNWGLNTSSENKQTTENYYGASATYGDFDIQDGNWNNSSFASSDVAIQTAIADIILPVHYPDAAKDNTIYTITFTTYDGFGSLNSSYKFICTKSAPNPEFELYDPTGFSNSIRDDFAVYPNPARDVMYIENLNSNLVEIFNLLGNTQKMISVNSGEIDISDLKPGMYLLKVENRLTKFCKE